MKECPVCRRCFSDHVNHCPDDGDATTQSITGDPILDGRYQLEKRLGHGGMGVVFHARHIFLKTQHAIKVILPDLVGNDPMLVTRFRQEALAAAAIRHRNIIAVTDFGVVRGTMPFLVMEYVSGKSLHELLATEGALPPARALEIISAVGAGVAAAHRQGIIHRDLKPLNVMFQEDLPIEEAVKVLDFGLAKIKSGELLGSFVQAKTSGLMGSPFYMAPEQWGDEEPDARADIYSLGVILYQMLGGEVPFRGTSIPSIMKKHLTEPPPPLSSLGVQVPPQIEAVVHHALEKEAENRPASVEDFINELRQSVEDITASLSRTALNTGGGRQAQTVINTPGATSIPPGATTLRVQTDPPRSRVYINNVSVGMTDAGGLLVVDDMLRGTHRIQVLHDGYAAWNSQVECDGGICEVSARLQSVLETSGPQASVFGHHSLEEKYFTGTISGPLPGGESIPQTSQAAMEAERLRRQAEVLEEQVRQEEAAHRAETVRRQEEARRQAAQDEQRRAEEEAARLRAEEESARRKAEAEAQQRAEEEARQRVAEEERLRAAEAARLKAEAEAREQAEAERVRAEEERLRLEAEAKRKAEEEAARRRAEEEERRLTEEARLAEEKRRKLEAEAAQRAEEEERQRREERERVERKRKQEQEQAASIAAASETTVDTQLSALNLDSTQGQRQGVTTGELGVKSLPGAESQPSGRSASHQSQTVLRQATRTVERPVPGGAVAPAKSSSARMLIAALVALLLVGGGIAAWYFLRARPETVTQQREGATPTPTTTATPTPGETPTPTPGPTPFKPDLISVPGGTFQMGRDGGSLPETPAHAVAVKPFAIDKTEVTNAEYADFVRETGHPPPSNWAGTEPAEGMLMLPVVNVSYQDAVAFAAWRSKRDSVTYRLPTEEEWEYAARGGDKNYLYPWGNEWVTGRAGLKDSDATGPKPVGSYPEDKTRWGALDMAGNVYEWTSSKASLYPGNPAQIDPAHKGWMIIRGGAYVTDYKQKPPSTYRDWFPSTTKEPVIGFRLVRGGASAGPNANQRSSTAVAPLPSVSRFLSKLREQ